MTRSLDSVVKTLASLPAEEQDRIDQSQDVLGQMADEALADLEAGRTTELDPEKL